MELPRWMTMTKYVQKLHKLNKMPALHNVGQATQASALLYKNWQTTITVVLRVKHYPPFPSVKYRMALWYAYALK
eukprot:12643017-Ditylum_brightwellii.AAC.1